MINNFSARERPRLTNCPVQTVYTFFFVIMNKNKIKIINPNFSFFFIVDLGPVENRKTVNNPLEA